MFLRQPIIMIFIFLTTIAVYAQPAPPLVGPLLAMNTVQQDRLIIYDLGSGVYRELMLGAGAHHVWDFSPDGCRLLVTLSEAGDTGRLITVNLDGSDGQNMVAYADLPANDWGVWSPDWSPTGERIAFVMRRTRGNLTENHIAWITPENPTPQFYSVAGREFEPQWSPDGAWLAYISYEERVAGANLFATAAPTLAPAAGQNAPATATVREADVWVVSANGQTKYELTRFATGSATMPRWSPDGSLVSYVYSPSGGNDMVWMQANQQGTIPTQLTYAWAMVLDHTWLPDGTHTLGSLRDFNEIDANRLWQIPLLGGDDANATLYIGDLDLNHADFPRISPDGEWLAVRTAYEMALVNLPDNKMALLDPMTLGNTPAVWSPIAFAGEADCR